MYTYIFSTSSPTPIICCLLVNSHSDGCEVWLAFLMISDDEAYFHILAGYL